MKLRLYTSADAFERLHVAAEGSRKSARAIKVSRDDLKALLMDHSRLVANAREPVDTHNPLPLGEPG